MTKKISKADAKLLADAKSSIASLNATLRQGSNSFGEYGRNCRAAISRHEATIARIEGKPC